jgi:CDGSH-type Zn-finger protein
MVKKKNAKIIIEKDGPYVVCGNLPLDKQIIRCSDKDGNPDQWEKGEVCKHQEKYALCRCGSSSNKPFCDGSHSNIHFKGTETASRKKYSEQAKKIDGPELVLKDAEELCAAARFCHKYGGVWNLTKASNIPKAKEAAIREACNCPSGRLVVCNKKTGKPIEPKFKPSLSLVEDPDNEVSGPIWVKGGVLIESEDGKKYEARNRVTLCRCGHSSNKPFCDGTHISAEFSDNDKSLKKKK